MIATLRMSARFFLLSLDIQLVEFKVSVDNYGQGFGGMPSGFCPTGPLADSRQSLYYRCAYLARIAQLPLGCEEEHYQILEVRYEGPFFVSSWGGGSPGI